MIKISEEERLGMILEENRIKSFKKWPFGEDENCSIHALAEAGFVWTGTEKNPNSAICFLCGKHLQGWESSDVPMEEHKQHSPECFFAVKGKPEGLYTAREFGQLYLKLLGILKNQASEKVEREVLVAADKLKQDLRNGFTANRTNK